MVLRLWSINNTDYTKHISLYLMERKIECPFHLLDQTPGAVWNKKEREEKHKILEGKIFGNPSLDTRSKSPKACWCLTPKNI